MSNSVTAKYQGADFALSLPDSWRLLGVGNPAPVEPLASLDVAVKKALASPIDSPSLVELAQGATLVTIVIDDQARPTPSARVLPTVLAELALAGVKTENVTIVIGKGTHRWPTDEEITMKVGAEVQAKCRVVVHDPDLAEDLIEVGTTSRGTVVKVNRAVAEADLVIGIGGVVTHYMAGYGGGPKLALPGVSSRQSIVTNHLLAQSDDAAQASTEGNPLYEDMLEAAKLARMELKIDLVLDMSNRPVDVIAGSLPAGHKAAIESYNRVFGYKFDEMADVTITSGYPLEIELLQSTKAILSADISTRDGGAIVLLSACFSGAGPGYAEALNQRPQIADVWRWVECGKTPPTGGTMVARVLGVLFRKRVIIVTDNLDAEAIRAMGFEYAPTPEAALAMLAVDFPEAKVYVFPAGAALNPLREKSLVS